MFLLLCLQICCSLLQEETALFFLLETLPFCCCFPNLDVIQSLKSHRLWLSPSFLWTHIYRTSRVTYHIRRTNHMPFLLLSQMPQYGVTPSLENKSLNDRKNNPMQHRSCMILGLLVVCHNYRICCQGSSIMVCKLICYVSDLEA